MFFICDYIIALAKKASPETVSLSAALSPYPRQAQPPAPCGRFASATPFPRVS